MGSASDAPLSGLRVVELESSVASRFAGKWLAALGAEVFKLESPGTQGEADHRALHLDAGKKSVRIETADDGGGEQRRQLLAASDLLLAGVRRGALAGLGLEAEALGRLPASFVSVCVSPFGDHGPYAELPSTPLTLAALSGMLWHVGAAGQPPLAQWGGQPEYLGGLHTFGAALSGVHAARTSGRGGHLDVVLHACAAAVIGHHTARVSQGGDPGRRRAGRALWRLYQTADGWAGVCALGRNYAHLAEAMQIPEIAKASPFLDYHKRPDQEARLTALLEEWFASRSCQEVSELAIRERVPLASALSIAEVASSQQLVERGFFSRSTDPVAGTFHLPARLWSSPSHTWRCEGAPQHGAHTREARALAAASVPPRSSPSRAASGNGLLSGARVLDLGQVWAGPYASMLLADQGADVIRVESPTAWDPNRCAALAPGTRDADWWNACPYYHEYNHNKRSIGLDLRSERGRELFGRLVERSDVIIENLRADVLDRLGIGYEWLCRQRPDVILVSMTGFGRSGPERDLPGYGPLIELLSGIAGLTGYENGAPQLTTGYAYGDPVAAVAAASAALTALIQRQQTGAGQHIDLAQREVTTALLGEAFLDWSTSGRSPEPLGNGHPGCAPYGVYPCRGDEEWSAIAVANDRQWQGLRAAMAQPAWQLP